ncbi:MAG: hypothetical protein ACREOO_04760 [bacterium]
MGPRTLFMRVKEQGYTLTPVPSVPGNGPLALSNGRIHGSDLVTVIDGKRLLFLGADQYWHERALPHDITTRDISFDPTGGLWIAGAVPSHRIPNASSEVAIRYQALETAAFEACSPRLSFLAAAKTIQHGGLETLRMIDVEGEPLIATSDCSWFLDDPSSFLFVCKEKDHWRVERLAMRSVRKLLRPTAGKLLVVTTEGDIFAVTATGVVRLIGKAATLHTAILSACPHVPAEAKLLVRGADADEAKLVVVTGLYVTIGTKLSWFVTAICQSIDFGASWAVRTKTAPVEGDPELLDVAMLYRTKPI